MGNHRTTAARIWRTIVCSGAMLGTPLGAAAEGPEPDAKQAPAKLSIDDQRKAAIDRELAAIDDKLIGPATGQGQYKMRKAPEKPLPATEQATLQAERGALSEAAKLIGAQPAAPDVLAAIDQLRNAKTDAQRTEARAKIRRVMEIRDLQARVEKANQDVTNAQSDADRTAAQTKLASLRKELDEKKKADAAKRPRTPERDRPLGRGFILS